MERGQEAARKRASRDVHYNREIVEQAARCEIPAEVVWCGVSRRLSRGTNPAAATVAGTLREAPQGD